MRASNLNTECDAERGKGAFNGGHTAQLNKG